MIDYNEKDRGGAFAEDEHKYAKLIQSKRFAKNKFAYVNGDSVTLSWLRTTGFREPFLVEEPEGLDMRMPPASLTVDQVADACGRDKIVDAMEVLTQADKQMTLDEWAKYFTQPLEKRKRLLNVISLEIGSTKLAQMIARPSIVRQLDWTDNCWPPRDLKPEFPAVQLYCLMSVKDCYTDFHIDFGGSSVFYHLLSGEKRFYFVRPTVVNLRKYERWSSSPDQGKIFFGDEVKECIEVRITAGNTMFIPTGWIHAVYTPQDSIVIGGNFLHGLNIPQQLDVYDLENRTNVPQRFRFPYFVTMQWYAARWYVAVLKSAGGPAGEMSRFEAEGVRRLLEFLKGLRGLMAEGGREKVVVRMGVPAEIRNVDKFVKRFEAAVLGMEERMGAVGTGGEAAGMGLQGKRLRLVVGSDEEDVKKPIKVKIRRVVVEEEEEVEEKSVSPVEEGVGGGGEEYYEDFDESDERESEGEEEDEFGVAVKSEEGKRKRRGVRKSTGSNQHVVSRDFPAAAVPRVPVPQQAPSRAPAVVSRTDIVKDIVASLGKTVKPAPKKSANVFNRLSKALSKIKRK
ncbi:Lysine-specific demethylase 7A [Podochytrium sp. JEL0797]|nr:Lysine-specific demethylase 7A [Podochytrium sp. JEL0797]